MKFKFSKPKRDEATTDVPVDLSNERENSYNLYDFPLRNKQLQEARIGEKVTVTFTGTVDSLRMESKKHGSMGIQLSESDVYGENEFSKLVDSED